MTEANPPPHLGVAHAELREALRTLRRFTKTRRPPEALLSFEKRALVIRLGGTTVRATAWGRWNGVARAPGHFLANFDRSLPDADPVAVRIRNGRLKIGASSFPCAWQEEVPEALRVPVDPGLLHLLRLPLEHRWEDIVRAGLGDVVEVAEARRDAVFERALRVLAPLEIEYRDLVECVEVKIRERFRVG
jgi:hypothetical protein